MPTGTLLYAQSGGVTAVINATASGVIQAARAKKVRVLAARNGILGALREDLVDTSTLSAAEVRALWLAGRREDAAANACSMCSAPTTCDGSSTTAATIRPIPR